MSPLRVNHLSRGPVDSGLGLASGEASLGPGEERADIAEFPVMSLLDMMSGLGASSLATPSPPASASSPADQAAATLEDALQPPRRAERHVLVLCDLQDDALGKVDSAQRDRLVMACSPLLRSDQ